MSKDLIIHGAGGSKTSRDSSGATMHQQTTRPPEETANTLRSRSTARFVDVISEGTIEGFVDTVEKSTYFDGIPWQNSDGTFNFTNIVQDFFDGNPAQGYWPGFPSIESTIAVGTEVTRYNPSGNKPNGTGAVTRTVTNTNIDAVRVTIRLDSLYFQVPPTSLFLPPPPPPDPPNVLGPPPGSVPGDIVEARVDFQVEVSDNGGPYVLKWQRNLIGKTVSPYEISKRIELTGTGPWDIRVTKTSDDFFGTYLEAYYKERMYFASYTEIIDEHIQYSDTAYIGSAIDATTFGGAVPTRSYEIKGIKVRIPSNYDPIARTYTGIWDGTYTVAWTSNPVFVLLDLITNERYGFGEFITDANIDKYSFYDVAQYCDFGVEDGKGGYEPRYTFNCVMNAREQGFNVFQAVASVFHGSLYWSNGMITLVADKPGSPVKVVNQANVIDGIFNYQGPSLKSRHTVAMVTWNDPEEGYRASVELVEDAEAVGAYGYKQIDVAAFGCTSRGQAYRLGKWILESEKTEGETVTYKASLDHANIRPGDLISLHDPSYAGIRYGGRLEAVIGSADVTVDSPVTFQLGESYQLSAVMPDGTVETTYILNDTGTQTTLSLDGFSQEPLPNAMWVITGTDVAPRQFRVISMRESDKNQFEVIALLHNPNKYNLIDFGFIFPTTPFTIIPTGPLVAPTNLAVVEYLYKTGATAKSAATFSWQHSADPRVNNYEVQTLPPFGSWTDVGATVNNFFDVLETFDGTWSFRVRARDGVGQVSAWSTVTVNLVALAAPPADVEDFKIDVVGVNVNLDWSPVGDVDLAYYQIRFAPVISGATWGTSAVLANNLTNTSWTGAAGIGTYLIKAFDTSGSESVNEALVITNVASIFGLNFIDTVTEDPAFAGTKDNVVLSLGALQIDDLSLGLGTYYFDNDYDLGGVFTSRLTAEVVSSGVLTTNIMASWVPLSIAAPLEPADPADWDVIVYVRTTDDDPTGTPTWSAWQPFVIGDYTARAFEFKLELISNDLITTPNVTALSVQIDMEERIEDYHDMIIPVNGTTVTYSVPFKEMPSIAISVHDFQRQDYYQITAHTTADFFIEFFDKQNKSVAREIDWIAKGYGYEI